MSSGQSMNPYGEITDQDKRDACERVMILMKSPTWPHVLRFAERMEAKLEKYRHKGDRDRWIKDAPEALLERLREEIRELENELVVAAARMNEPLNRITMANRVADESADIANFAMMIADGFIERAANSH